jgi:hypothetical protein
MARVQGRGRELHDIQVWLSKEGSSMTLLDDGHIRHVFERSNIAPNHWDYNVKILDEILRETSIFRGDVVAISLTEEPQRLFVVALTAVALGQGKGVLKMRVEVEKFSYTSFDELQSWAGEGTADGTCGLDAIGHNSAPLFELTWLGAGFTTNPEAERDRVFRATRDTWQLPFS